MSGLTRRSLLANSLLAALAGTSFPSFATSSSSGRTPWYNWSGALKAQPQSRFSPANIEQLQQMLKTSTGEIRPVGSGHSFSPLVPTDGHLIVLDQLTQMTAHDDETLQATFGAGVRLGDIGPMLAGVNQAMLNLPDIDRQTLAGATATATHGTGIAFTSLSSFVTQIQLVTPRGEVMNINPDDELLNAAQVNLGVLGIVTSMTLQNQRPYKLKANNWVQPIEEVLEDFDAKAAAHRHFEMFPLTHSNYALVLSIDETDEDINNPPPSPEEEAGFAQAMAYWSTLPPKERMPLIDGLAEQIEPTSAVDESFKILSNIRNNRFNEMEYSVPVEAGAACLREVLATIIKEEIDVVFPLEYRYVKRDNTWLGMSSGDHDHAAISIHRTAGEDYRPYFDLIEPIFWKYGGRPHWGKIHSLGAKELSQLYPRFKDFQELRRDLDPEGRLLNKHLRHVFNPKT